MSSPFFKQCLSVPRQQLVSTMQHVGHGVVKALHVRNGEPSFEPIPQIVREIKLGAENGPRPELNRPDFQLKSRVIELFEVLGTLDNSTVDIDVKHGLPFRVVIQG